MGVASPPRIFYGKIAKMLLDEANDFSSATADDMAFKMFDLPDSFKILKGYFAFKILLY